MKVDKSKLLTPDEEYTSLQEQIRNVPDFIIWDVHPNVIRATNIRLDKLQRKIDKLIATPEFLYYNEL